MGKPTNRLLLLSYLSLIGLTSLPLQADDSSSSKVLAPPFLLPEQQSSQFTSPSVHAPAVQPPSEEIKSTAMENSLAESDSQSEEPIVQQEQEVKIEISESRPSAITMASQKNDSKKHSHHHHHHKKEYNVYLEAEYLYWRPRTNGLRYGTVGGGTDASPTVTNYQKTVRMNPDFDSGIRAKIAYDLPRDHWRLSAEWTYYHNSTHSERSIGNSLYFVPYMVNKSFGPNALGGAHAHWSFNMNYADLVLSRSFKPSHKFTLTPYMGARAAWIDQDFHIKYINVFVNQAPIFPFIRNLNDSNFYGYGMRGGLDAMWELGYGFGLYGNAAVSALWSHFNVIQSEYSNTQVLIAKSVMHLNSVTPVFEAKLGFNWHKAFSKKRFFIDLHVGWEQQIWFDQIQWAVPNNSADSYDAAWLEEQQYNLGLSGFTAGATFGF